MEKINVDFTNCRYLGEIHQTLKECLNFPDYYGENLDALFDCLDYFTNENVKITIVGLGGYAHIGKHEADYVHKMIEVFSDVTEKSPNIQFEYID